MLPPSPRLSPGWFCGRRSATLRSWTRPRARPRRRSGRGGRPRPGARGLGVVCIAARGWWRCHQTRPAPDRHRPFRCRRGEAGPVAPLSSLPPAPCCRQRQVAGGAVSAAAEKRRDAPAFGRYGRRGLVPARAASRQKSAGRHLGQQLAAQAAERDRAGLRGGRRSCAARRPWSARPRRRW